MEWLCPKNSLEILVVFEQPLTSSTLFPDSKDVITDRRRRSIDHDAPAATLTPKDVLRCQSL